MTVNKNAAPNDPTSGLRISTAVATRGFMAEECRALTVWICDVLDHLGDADVEAQVGRQAAQLCALPYYSFQHETQKRVLDTG